MRFKKIMSLVIATIFLCSGCMYTIQYEGLLGIRQIKRNNYKQRYNKMFRDFTALRTAVELSDLEIIDNFFQLQIFIEGLARMVKVAKDLLETTDFGVEGEILDLEKMLKRCEILTEMTTTVLAKFLEIEELSSDPDPDMEEEPEFPEEEEEGTKYKI